MFTESDNRRDIDESEHAETSSEISRPLSGAIEDRHRILKYHMNTHSEKRYACVFCNYQAMAPSRLKRHMLIHTGEKPFKCSICNRQFAEKGNAKQHMKAHTGEKPFACNACDYKSSRRSCLKVHMMNCTRRKIK